MSIRAQVISTIDEKGIDQMGPDDLIVKYHSVDVRTRSRLIVYSNQKAVVRIQGQIQGVFDPGAHDLQTPANPISQFFAKFQYAGNVPWEVEVLFASTARHEARSEGITQTKELVPMRYQVAYYFMITDPVKFINAVQFSGFKYTVEDFKNYVSPIVDQAVSQVLNLVSLNEVYANLHKVTDAVTASLRSFLDEVGVHLITCRIVRLEPEDETMRRVVQFMALGLDVNTAIRARLAEIMAQRSDPAATNMMLGGVPYYPIYILPTAGMPSGLPQLMVPPTQQRQQSQQGGSSQSSDFEISGGG
ncbi:SPFH domain-containing protein [Vulcanisaeta distributa]|uniref:SPFH domain-containing protein n=1 Tax=Vulcanisaeta distributa TaxID=164451 RepID=UPI0006D0D0BF|nr:SPFH domain-containing protein [Vulcanisaeta distributa]